HTKPPFERQLNADVQTMGGVRAQQLHAELPEGAASRLAPNWDEDLLLPRQWDGRGHAAGILAPGGWIAKTDPEGKTWEIITSGRCTSAIGPSARCTPFISRRAGQATRRRKKNFSRGLRCR